MGQSVLGKKAIQSKPGQILVLIVTIIFILASILKGVKYIERILYKVKMVDNTPETFQNNWIRVERFVFVIFVIDS